MPHQPPAPEGTDADQRFGRLVDTFVHCPGVTTPGEPGHRGFGSDALKINGSIFAMLAGGRLVVKLSPDRVQALIHDGTGIPFTAGKRSPMRQWLTVIDDADRDEAEDVPNDDRWLTLAREALDFVANLTTQRR